MPDSPDPAAPPAAAPPRRDWPLLAGGGVLFVALLLYSGVWRLHGPLPPVVALLVAGAMTAILRAARVTTASIVVVLGGLGLQVVYFAWTGPLVRNVDAPAQLLYISYILEHHALPSNGTCVVCHHPPLYYLLAAAARRALELGHVSRIDSGLQAFSFVVFSAFVLFSALVIERLAPARLPRVLATALVIFWPYTVINSVRIHNDTAFYAVAAAAFYLIVRWTQDGGRRRLILACGVALVGLFVKANAVILVGLVLVLVAYRLRAASDRRAVLREAAPVIGLFLCLVVAGSLVRGERGAGPAGRVLGTAYYKPPSAFAKRSFRYYLTFDPSAMFSHPFAMVHWLHPNGRQPSYWNHLLKSSLHGTRNFLQVEGDIKESPRLALAANGALLALTGFLFLGLLLSVRDSSRSRSIVLLAIGVYVLTGLAFHVLVPVGHHADFRLIYPVLAPMSLLYAQVVADLRRRRFRLWPAWVVVACGFMAITVGYFVPAVVTRFPPGRGDAATPPAGRFGRPASDQSGRAGGRFRLPPITLPPAGPASQGTRAP